MSNSRAIAGVTAALRSLLDRQINADPTVDPNSDHLAHTEVTTRPPDRARNNITGNQLNLFLYQTVHNAAWRNMDLPREVKPGETGSPPLPLNLYYLVTAYCDDDETDGITSHWLLGRAMSVLHDHPLLGRQELESAMPGSGLQEQIERLRITPQPLSLQELFNLWSTFQTQYRVSAAYEVTVVLIESTQAARAPLPVLTRGPGDRGVTAQPDLIPPFSALEAAHPPSHQASVRPGEILTLEGYHLDGDSVIVRFINRPILDEPIEVAPQAGGTATAIQVQVPDEPEKWPAGFYTVDAVIQRAGEPDRTTGELPLSLAPSIATLLPNPAARDGNGNVTLTLTCSPQVWPVQQAALLLGDRYIVAQPHAARTNTLTFIVPAAPVGEHWVRLRVDGVDSLLVDRSVTPPVFDPSQKVKIT
jgi:hypothetical protein